MQTSPPPIPNPCHSEPGPNPGEEPASLRAGHDFSRAAKPLETSRASAPATFQYSHFGIASQGHLNIEENKPVEIPKSNRKISTHSLERSWEGVPACVGDV
jgi:hypothetical protein